MGNTVNEISRHGNFAVDPDKRPEYPPGLQSLAAKIDLPANLFVGDR
jgi:hypothetical protein